MLFDDFSLGWVEVVLPRLVVEVVLPRLVLLGGPVCFAAQLCSQAAVLSEPGTFCSQCVEGLARPLCQRAGADLPAR